MTQIIKEKYDINLETQKFILQMCWAQHDGQWFLKSKRELGIQKANDLNKMVISMTQKSLTYIQTIK